METLIDLQKNNTIILSMNIEQIEQKCAETLLDYAITMCTAYVDEPEDFNAAVVALLARTLENHLNRPINIQEMYQ